MSTSTREWRRAETGAMVRWVADGIVKLRVFSCYGSDRSRTYAGCIGVGDRGISVLYKSSEAAAMAWADAEWARIVREEVAALDE